MMKRTSWVKLVSASILLMAAVLAAVYWNEARKEVVYLCGNFVKGVTQSSVLKQLDTGSFLRYRLVTNAAGSRIDVDSKFNFGRYKCMIEFDPEGTVVHAEIQP